MYDLRFLCGAFEMRNALYCSYMCDVAHQVKNIERIELGKYEMETWYFSPLPAEFKDCKVGISDGSCRHAGVAAHTQDTAGIAVLKCHKFVTRRSCTSRSMT